jgi:DNA invertase Pin-like site-specific DNA recombinase
MKIIYIFVKNYKMAKSKNRPGSYSYTWKDDKLVLKDVCFECGSVEDIHYHHIVPSTMGGTKTIPLCIICHGKVHNKDFVKLRELQKIGIKRAQDRGAYKGRPKGSWSESTETFLNKDKSKKIIELLENGNSYSEIESIVPCSTTTIIKIKRLIYGEPQKRIGPHETSEEFLNKSKSKKIIELLEKGYLFKEIASIVPCSKTTVAKVNNLINGKSL